MHFFCLLFFRKLKNLWRDALLKIYPYPIFDCAYMREMGLSLLLSFCCSSGNVIHRYNTNRRIVMMHCTVCIYLCFCIHTVHKTKLVSDEVLFVLKSGEKGYGERKKN